MGIIDDPASDGSGGERTEFGWSDDPPDSAVSFPEQIGRYRLIELLGRGGMGSVFLAEQTKPIKRQVALKLISSTVNSDQTLRRFEAERQAMARMNHPNIAQVYDAGASEKGEPFVVMELITGQPITKHCDEHRFSVRGRIELMIAVCEGVQHAHQKGIIHRDLKPSNVLVSHNGEMVPKIIDFGIAKAVDEQLTDLTLLTRADTVVGTPVYMSPERLKPQGDLDTRADIYSLGVLLYELLTGELPFKTDEGIFEVAEQVLTAEVARPSTKVTTVSRERLLQLAEQRATDSTNLAKRLDGDLDWITLKAMARERERRYSSATELAADLRRHLNREPVEARPPTLVYRMERFIRRHWLGVAAGVLVALSLVAGIIGTAVQARRANLEAERANNEAVAAQQVSDFLIELFEVSDPSEAQGETITAREILDRGAAKIDHDLADQPLTRARLQHTMGRVYSSLGLYAPAGELIAKSLESRQQLLEAPHPDLADSLGWMGQVKLRDGDLEAAEDFYLQSVAIEEQLETNDPTRLASRLSLLAQVYREQGRYAEAEAVLQRALGLLDGTDQPLKRVGVLIGLGNVNALVDHRVEALDYFREAQRILESEPNPDPLAIGNILDIIGVNLTDLRRYDEAGEALKRSLQIFENVYEPGHPRTTIVRLNLANLTSALGKTEEAVEIYEQVLEDKVRELGPNHLSLGPLVFNLANLYEFLERSTDAEHHAEWALRIFTTSLSPEHHLVGLAEAQVAHVLQASGRTTEAAPHAEKALKILTAAVGSDHLDTGIACNLLARISVDQGRYDRAEELFLRTGEILRANEESISPDDIAQNLLEYADLLRSLGRDDEAADLESQASAIGESTQ